MKTIGFSPCLALIVITAIFPGILSAWHDETHLAVAKAAGYHRWYNAVGADIAKIKAGKPESQRGAYNVVEKLKRCPCPECPWQLFEHGDLLSKQRLL